MGVSTTTNNEWPQIEERVALMPGNHHQQRHHPHHHHLHGAATGAINSVSAAAATAAGRAMENQQALKCPRCDSSNTKFCYYNNYSLSQPRHFCKACKRYWTRGGTLRNVPVGGGCRKNKRIKKPSSSSSAAAHASAISDPPSLPLQISNLSLPQSSSTAMDPVFYGFHNNSTDLNLPANFPSFLKRLEQRNVMSNLTSCTDHYDINPHLSSLGLCFPMNATTTATTATHQDYNTVQYHTPDSAALAASTASTSLVHDYSLLGSSLSSSTAASLLAASLRQPKMGANNSSGWPTTPYDDIQAAMAGGSLGLFKEIKEEDGSNVVNHNGRLEYWQIPCENPLENIGAVDGTSLYWNVNAAAIGGGWPEAATNCGSSVTPLI